VIYQVKEELPKAALIYGLIGSRLSETKQAFVISRALNEAFGGDVSEAHHQMINEVSAVAWPVLWSCQVATFTGLGSVLEDQEGSASIPYLAKLIRAEGNEVPPHHEAVIKDIAEKYRVYRNKLFSHNSVRREIIREQFNSAKISWETLAKDFEAVEKAYFQIADCSPSLSLEIGPWMMEKEVQATEATIQDLIAKFKG
jgi:hypothetical protein